MGFMSLSFPYITSYCIVAANNIIVVSLILTGALSIYKRSNYHFSEESNISVFGLGNNSARLIRHDTTTSRAIICGMSLSDGFGE